MRTFKKGSLVRCAYRDGHIGIVLSWLDPRAWAGTLAFPEANPDPEAVRQHVLWCHRDRNATNRARGISRHSAQGIASVPRIPVLYSFGVRWDTQLAPVFVVELIHEGTALGVVRATPENTGDGEALMYREACDFARRSAGFLGCRWFDLTLGAS